FPSPDQKIAELQAEIKRLELQNTALENTCHDSHSQLQNASERERLSTQLVESQKAQLATLTSSLEKTTVREGKLQEQLDEARSYLSSALAKLDVEEKAHVQTRRNLERQLHSTSAIVTEKDTRLQELLHELQSTKATVEKLQKQLLEVSKSRVE
ncbi:hypothetical protein HDU93_004008, partial [Gonapodya sp. JEL0774]